MFIDRPPTWLLGRPIFYNYPFFGTKDMDRSRYSDRLAAHDLDELRKIIFGDYQARLDQLEARLCDTEAKLSELRRYGGRREQILQDEIARLKSEAETNESLLNKQIDGLRTDLAEREVSHRAEVAELHEIFVDKTEVLETVEPEIPRFVQTSIKESKEEMIDAIHPIMGALVIRSVSESMRELARNIDDRMRGTFNLGTLTQRLRARATGVSEVDIAIRQSLPFKVDELFLVHTETGILLQYLARKVDPLTNTESLITEDEDSEVISGMLTAFQDFVEDAFGSEDEGSLDEFQYGQKQVHIKPGRHIYIAVVIQGIAPRGFGATISDHVYRIESEYAEDLREFTGNMAVFDDVAVLLKSIMDAQ